MGGGVRSTDDNACQSHQPLMAPHPHKCRDIWISAAAAALSRADTPRAMADCLSQVRRPPNRARPVHHVIYPRRPRVSYLWLAIRLLSPHPPNLACVCICLMSSRHYFERETNAARGSGLYIYIFPFVVNQAHAIAEKVSRPARYAAPRGGFQNEHRRG